MSEPFTDETKARLLRLRERLRQGGTIASDNRKGYSSAVESALAQIDSLQKQAQQLEIYEAELSRFEFELRAARIEVERLGGAVMRLSMLVGSVPGLRAEIERLKNMSCTVCAGDDPESMPSPCICGGGGTVWDETHGLRKECMRQRERIAALEAKLTPVLWMTYNERIIRSEQDALSWIDQGHDLRAYALVSTTEPT